MNSVEQAIRVALAKGDATDDAFRSRIYGSASAALERSLAARNFSEHEIVARRQGLATTIKHIESEFAVAVEPETVQAQSAVQTPEISISAAESERPVSRKKREVAAAPKRPEYENVKRFSINAPKNKRRWWKYGLNIGFLVVLIVGGVWAYSESKRIYANATTPNGVKPPLSEAAESTAEENTDWVKIFSATDTDLITAPQGAKAEIASRDGLNYVVMTSDAGLEVSIKVGSGLMQTFAGQRVLFNIKARSVGGSIHDAGARCDFGAETKCERKRFKIGPQSAEYMFAVSVSANANGDGALLIAPDLTGAGGAVEIENIRATIVKPDAG